MTFTGSARVAMLLAGLSSAAAQEQQFLKLCVACHGEGAKGTDRGPALADNRGLRGRSTEQIRDVIRNGTPGGMPPFPLPAPELDALAGWVHSLNASAYDLQPAGDPAAGE